MEIKEAIELIRFTPNSKPLQIWADLGCGSGLFTRALASLLPASSRIYAIDIDEKALSKLPKEYNGVAIEISVRDFTSDKTILNQVDGILMANSLHYVKEKEKFVKGMLGALGSSGYFLLVDYDMNKANHWVPYPLPIIAAEELFLKCGAPTFEVLNKRRSVFGDQWMYAALVKK